MEDSNHFTIPVKKVSPLPISVIDITTLDDALKYPKNGVINFCANPASDGNRRKDSPSPIGIMDREPMEIVFLSELDRLTVSHNIFEGLFNCPPKQLINFRVPDSSIVMQGIKNLNCKCTHENYEIFNQLTSELAILVEIVQGTWSVQAPTSIQVYGPPGRALGFVCRYGSEEYEIQNTVGDPAFTIHGITGCCIPSRFSVMVAGNSNWKVAELVIDGCGWSWTIQLTFTEKLSPSRRALIIGLALLIDAVEHQKRAQRIELISGLTVSISGIIAGLSKAKVL